MSILAECPYCHRKQAVNAKVCKSCTQDLDKAKKAKKVKFWISYYLPGTKKQRRECVGVSIQEARDAEGKRRGQKRENRIFDILPEYKMTFQELSEWYLGLEKVKELASYKVIGVYLKKFNSELGDRMVAEIKLADLENLQVKRKREGLKPKTIDEELGHAKTVVIKAFDNDLVGGGTLKTFRKLKRLLRNDANRGSGCCLPRNTRLWLRTPRGTPRISSQ